MTLVFVDVETTSLRADRRAWEVALIVRSAGPGSDTEMSWMVDDIDLSSADPFSLRVGGFWDRHPMSPDFDGRRPVSQPESVVARIVDELIRKGVTLVGACPWFDEQTLDAMLRRHGRMPRWHHRLRDVESLAAGFLGREAGGLRSCADALGVPYVEADLHTALGDARLARDVWDHVMAAERAGLDYVRVVEGRTG